MNQTTNKGNLESAIAVDINGLMKLLNCGEHTATLIAAQANAVIPNTNKRKLYSVDRIREYVLTATQHK